MFIAYYIGFAVTLVVLAFGTNATDDMAYMLMALFAAGVWPLVWAVAIGMAIRQSKRGAA